VEDNDAFFQDVGEIFIIGATHVGCPSVSGCVGGFLAEVEGDGACDKGEG